MDIFSPVFLNDLHKNLLSNNQNTSSCFIHAYKQLNKNYQIAKNQILKNQAINQYLKQQLAQSKISYQSLLQKYYRNQYQLKNMTEKNFSQQKTKNKQLQYIKKLTLQAQNILNHQNNSKKVFATILNDKMKTIRNVVAIFTKYQFQSKNQLLNEIINILTQQNISFQSEHSQILSSSLQSIQKQKQNAIIQDEQKNLQKQKNTKTINKKGRKRKSVTEKSILKKVKLLQIDRNSVDNDQKTICNDQSMLTLLINGQVFQETHIKNQSQQTNQKFDQLQQVLIQQQLNSFQDSRKNKKHLSLKLSVANSYNDSISDQQSILKNLQFKANSQLEQMQYPKNLTNSKKRSSKQSYYLSICDNISDSKEKCFLSPQTTKIAKKQIEGRIRWQYKKFVQKRQESLKTIYFSKSNKNNLKDQIKQNQIESQKQNSQHSHISFFQASSNCL